MLGYSFRYDAANLGERLWAEVMPSRGMVADGVITFRESRGGHFIVDADVDGVSIPFLVDTGASDVTLKPSDARRLGFDLDGLSYDRTYRTANGTVRGASVRLRRVTIGPISVTQVRASVNAAEMTRSLLGMSFLSRLSGFEVAQGRLTLRPLTRPIPRRCRTHCPDPSLWAILSREGGVFMTDQITGTAALRTLYGEPNIRAANKALVKLDKHCRAFIGLSPFCVLGSAASDGTADCSPKGDAPGFVQVLDDETLLIPDRRGNNRWIRCPISSKTPTSA